MGLETARLPVEEGITDIGVSPDGAWAVAVNPDAEKAYLLQTAHNRITHQVPVPGVPDRVTFTVAAAYIHTSGSPAMTAIPLEEIDPAGDVSVLTIPIGERPAGAAGTTVTADAITATPDGEALLIANPADDQVYFYTEGSQSALGGFQGHTLIPRAVQVVDRSLKEPSPGVYTGSIRIPVGGDSVVAFLLDSPQLTHCFSFTAPRRRRRACGNRHCDRSGRDGPGARAHHRRVERARIRGARIGHGRPYRWSRRRRGDADPCGRELELTSARIGAARRWIRGGVHTPRIGNVHRPLRHTVPRHDVPEHPADERARVGTVAQRRNALATGHEGEHRRHGLESRPRGGVGVMLVVARSLACSECRH